MKRMILGMLMFALVAMFTSGTLQAKESRSMNLESEHSYNQYLIKALQDTNMGVRFSAAKLLGERKCLHAKEHLLDVLKNDKHYQNRIAAGLALMKMGDADILPQVKKQAKNDKCKTVRHVLKGIVHEMSKENYLTLQ